MSFLHTFCKTFYAQHSNSCISTPTENWTHVNMNLFTGNSPYYHHLKYLPFLLKHPVYVTTTNIAFLLVRFLSPVNSSNFVELNCIFIMYCNVKIVRSSPLSLVTAMWTGRLRNRSSIFERGRILPPYLVENCRGPQNSLCCRCRSRESVHTHCPVSKLTFRHRASSR